MNRYSGAHGLQHEPKLRNRGMSNEKPQVSVIIPNLNGRMLIGDCLASLERQQFKDFEVILVDNGSTDGSVGYVRGHLQLGFWLDSQELAPDDKIALMDIGLVGYVLTPQPILDITGLTDRHIAKSPGMFLDKQYDPLYILDQKPAFIIFAVTRKPQTAQGKMFISEEDLWSDIERRIYIHPAFRNNYEFSTIFDHYSRKGGYYLLVFKQRA